MAQATPTTESPISGASVRRGDRVFGGLSKSAGILVLVIMAAIGIFLLWKALPALQANTANFLTSTNWSPDADPPAFGIAALAFGTLISSIIAMVLAVLDASPLDAMPATRLGAAPQAQHDALAFKRRYLHLATEREFGEGHRDADREVVAGPAEHRVRPHVALDQ